MIVPKYPMRFTARSRIKMAGAIVSSVQSDEDTYDMSAIQEETTNSRGENENDERVSIGTRQD
jgi:hypothetical protein